jgi:hypothetical protein
VVSKYLHFRLDLIQFFDNFSQVVLHLVLSLKPSDILLDIADVPIDGLYLCFNLDFDIIEQHHQFALNYLSDVLFLPQ